MNFGEAIEKLKEGRRLYREGWNGIKRGLEMYIEFVSEKYEGGWLFKAHINMVYNVEENPFIVIGWLASQEDMLSDDWETN